MRIKDFLDVFMKISGLLYLLKIISIEFTVFYTLIYTDFSLYSLLYVIFSIFSLFLILYFFVFKTEVLIKKMNISENTYLFEETNVSKEVLLSVGIILLGFYILVFRFIDLIVELKLLLFSNYTISGMGGFGWEDLIFMSVGVLLIVKNKVIVRLMIKW